MRRIIWGILIPMLTLSVGSANARGQAKPATPAEQYKALLKEYQAASGGGASSDEERMKHMERVFATRNKLGQQFVDLAEKNPKDPVALDALIQAVWQVNTTPWPASVVGEDAARSRAFAILQRDHVRSDKLGPVCQRVSFGFCKEYETFLRAVLEKNPHKDVQALACLSLAHYLKIRAQRLELHQGHPDLAVEFADLYGKGYLEGLQRQDRDKAGKEVESLFERAAKEYGDVKVSDGTVGKSARAELYELRHLVVGKEAPNIEGTDQDGKRFELRDYRGKVVLLDFWSEY